MNPGIILASASPRRTELLQSLGVRFEVVPSSARELHDESLGPERLCAINAERKAAEVAGRRPDSIIIGADTLVALEDTVFGKPRDLEEARRTLALLSGRTHQVITGVALFHHATGREELFTEITQVQFRLLSPAAIEDYLSLVHVLDKAGAYALQEHGEKLAESVNGSRSNVIGLPLEKLSAALRRWGVPLAPLPATAQVSSRG